MPPPNLCVNKVANMTEDYIQKNVSAVDQTSVILLLSRAVAQWSQREQMCCQNKWSSLVYSLFIFLKIREQISKGLKSFQLTENLSLCRCFTSALTRFTEVLHFSWLLLLISDSYTLSCGILKEIDPGFFWGALELQIRQDWSQRRIDLWKNETFVNGIYSGATEMLAESCRGLLWCSHGFKAAMLIEKPFHVYYWRVLFFKTPVHCKTVCVK